jgi:hypothetical protein
MDTGIKKVAKIVKRKGKFCVVGHKKSKDGKHRNFGCYDSKEEATKRLGQIYMFKHKKAELLDTIIEVSDELTDKGMFHIADALAGCMEAIALESIEDNTVLKLGKIVGILQKKGESEVAERIDAMLPELLCFGDCGCTTDAPTHKVRMTADKAYKMANSLKAKYLNGAVDEKSFEYAKMKELESMLKMGFLLPPPIDYKELPTGSKNWWEHFTNRGAK